MITPLRIPPGIYRNGTAYQSKGRWYDADLVRFRAGTVQAIHGWERIGDDAFTGICRGIITWRDDDGVTYIVTGSPSKLEVFKPPSSDGWSSGFSSGFGEGVLKKDITPTGMTAGITDATATVWADTWSLDTWGENLVGCLTSDGDLVEWALDYTTPTLAAAITNAPTSCRALVVTADRILMALGAGGNPRKVQWCDQEANTTWTAAATNQAGDFELATPGRIICGKRLRGQTIICTTQDAWIATYVGQPFIYSFEKVGDGCGIVAANSLVVVDGWAAWLGSRQFYVFDGAVRAIPCDVLDYLHTNMSETQISKTYGWHNSEWNEIWWHYQSTTGSEVDSYVAWNYVENHWTIGTLARTAGVGVGAWKYPILAGSNGQLYGHERGGSFSSRFPSVESGPLEIGDGERVVSVNYLWPDEATLGELDTYFYASFYPTETETEYGPYTASEPTSVRFTGRQFRIKGVGSENEDWRLGVPRLDVIAGGKR